MNWTCARLTTSNWSSSTTVLGMDGIWDDTCVWASPACFRGVCLSQLFISRTINVVNTLSQSIRPNSLRNSLHSSRHTEKVLMTLQRSRHQLPLPPPPMRHLQSTASLPTPQIPLDLLFHHPQLLTFQESREVLVRLLPTLQLAKTRPS